MAAANSTMRNSRVVPVLLVVLILLVIGFALDRKLSHAATKFQTPYQAVLLTNGSVFFGKVQGYGTDYPVMTNVFYIVTRTDAQTHQSSNVLVKRGKELHAPDRMYLNPAHILFIEPVGPSSKVADLISQAGQ